VKLNQEKVREFAETMERIAALLEHRWYWQVAPPTVDDFVGLVNLMAEQWTEETVSLSSGGVTMRVGYKLDDDAPMTIELTCALGRKVAMVEEL